MKKSYKIVSIVMAVFVFCLIFNIFARAASDPPTVSIDIAPTKGMIQPGQEFTARASTEGFSMANNDAEKMHFNWCMDNVPLNTLITGSNDKLEKDLSSNPGGPYHLENEYGSIYGPFEICNYTDYIYPYAYGSGPFTVTRDNNVWERSVNEPFNIVPREYDLTRDVTEAEDLDNREDSDNDGMSDEWEWRYFSGRRVVIEDLDGFESHSPNLWGYVSGTVPDDYEEGDEIVFYYSTDRTELLAQVSPGDDPDRDGWIYSYTDAYEVWDDDDSCAPGWLYDDDCDRRYDWGKYGRPETLRIPRISADPLGGGNDIGDGKFTNWEEFVAGTDPLNPDTDGDGITEELDWAGNQQDLWTDRVEKDWGDEYVLHVNAFGIDQRYEDGDYRKDNKYYKAMYPRYFDETGEQNITPEGDNVLTVGTGLAFETAMGYSPAPVLPGDTVQVVSESTMLGQYKGLDLLFRWFLDGEVYDDTTADDVAAESGFGKKTFQFKADKPACHTYTVGLEVTEQKTRKISYNEMEVRMGFQPTLYKTILGNADLTQKAAQDYNQRVGTEATWESLVLTGNDNQRTGVSPDKGYRKGDIVMVTVNDLEEDYNSECSDDTFEEYAAGLGYRWNYTRKEQETKSGEGENYRSAVFIVNGDPRTSEGASGEPADSLLEDSNEFVSIEISDSNGNVIAREKEDMKTIAPYVNFDVIGAEQGTSREDTNKPIFQAAPGTEITISANLGYFRPSQGFTYVWKRNGEIVSEMMDTDVTESTYTFNAGVSADGKTLDITKDVISVEVVNDISGSGGAAQTVTESAEQSTEIEIVSGLGEGGVDIAGGFLKRFIPNYYRNVFNLSLAAAATCIAVILVMGFVGGTEGSRKK